MSVKLLSPEYEVVERDNKYYVYDPSYENSVTFIFLGALMDVIYPLPDTFLIPLCLEIEKGPEEVTVNEKLEVTGTTKYKYFIAKKQYENWKKTYYALQRFLCLLILLINLLCIYLFWDTNYSIGMGVAVACIAGLTAVIFRKFRSEIKMRMKYEMRDVKFS